ncbi:hypothetical protein C7S16_4143 [Burkholderia thailandensis]|uniref:Uncharacterized protein n=1 Tax=Burkholderia thailandensis TaxID=57975 RepID=A0AAW9D536_BURTH|nr:hypothetical protein [Burkholderia thailandensis]
MHRAPLARFPDERHDRIAAGRIGREQVATIAGRAAFALRRREEIGRRGGFGERGAQLARERRVPRRRGFVGERAERGVEPRAKTRDRRRRGRGEVATQRRRRALARPRCVSARAGRGAAWSIVDSVVMARGDGGAGPVRFIPVDLEKRIPYCSPCERWIE